jgi:hypothetical protein
MPNDGGCCRGDLVERALVSLSTGWSFREAISVESLARRDVEDVIAAMELLKREVAPLWDGHFYRPVAEELFAGLAAGRVPEQFAEPHIMALTGWSWETLQETPADVVELMAVYLAVRQVRDVGGTLDFPEEQHER